MGDRAAAAPWRAPVAVVVLMVASACVLSIAGCGSSPPIRLHAVEGVPGTPPLAAYTGPPLAVRSVEVPPAWDRSELLADGGGGAFALREFDHWAAPLGRSARQALTESLARRLPTGTVVFPGAARPAGAVDIDVDVLAFKVSGGTATIWLAWTLRPTRGVADVGSASTAPSSAVSNTTRLSSSAEMHAEVFAGDSAADTAQAFSALLGLLADRIVAQVAAAESG